VRHHRLFTDRDLAKGKMSFSSKTPNSLVEVIEDHLARCIPPGNFYPSHIYLKLDMYIFFKIPLGTIAMEF
jgi:hypothetical protein